MTKKPRKRAPDAAQQDDDTPPDSGRRERAIVALLSTPTILQAAEVAGIHERTLRRWLKVDSFAEELRHARRQTVAQASTRLVSSCGSASEVLISIAEDADAPHAARVTAARTVLEMARDFIQIDDLDARLAALENAAGRQA